MKINLSLFLLFISFLLTAEPLVTDLNKDVKVIEIRSSGIILEEWLHPGRYSPVNAFDGNINTCVAEKDPYNSISFMVNFQNHATVDEIRIMNGFGKNDVFFKKNNRAGDLWIFFGLDNKKVGKEKFILKDQKEFQSLKLKDSCTINRIEFYFSGEKIYNGSKYNDTCVTEIELYYKGKKIEINNIDELQKGYLNSLNQNLVKAFTGRNYVVADSGQGIIKFCKDSTVFFSDSPECRKDEVFVCLSNYIPAYWKIENSKLYMRRKEKWEVYRYEIIYDYSKEEYVITDLIIYTNSLDDKSGFGMRNKIEFDKN